MFDISPIQIIIVLAIALLIFGPKRLPDLGRNLGKGIRDFKGGITGEEEPVTPATPPAPAATVEPEVTTAEAVIKEAARPEPVGADEKPPAQVL